MQKRPLPAAFSCRTSSGFSTSIVAAEVRGLSCWRAESVYRGSWISTQEGVHIIEERLQWFHWARLLFSGVTLVLTKLKHSMGSLQRRCLYAFIFGLLRAVATAASDAFNAVSCSDRGALKLLYWATNGRAWNNGWDIQNEMSDPCLDQVRMNEWVWQAQKTEYMVSSGTASRVTTPFTSSRSACQAITSLVTSPSSSRALHCAFSKNCTPILLFEVSLVTDRLSAWLRTSDLSSNFLTGSVPSTLAKFAQLRVLRLDRNWFDGALPASLGTLAFLEYLYVQGS
jgi:hypothetical protein